MITMQFERRYLAEVLRHARRHLGWQPPPRWEGGWRHPTTGATVDIDRRVISGTVVHELGIRRHWGDAITWIPVRSVREAVDVLCALGILPPEMASAWVAGYLTWPNPRRRISPDGYLKFCPDCGDDLWCAAQSEGGH